MKLPQFARSLRFRMSGITTAVSFGIGGLALGAVYVAVLYRLRELTVRTLVVTQQPVELNDGRVVLLPRLAEGEIRTLESVIKEAFLNQVAVITLIVLGGLFLLSLVVGWFTAGRALAPVSRITRVAQEIEATDLSRRIGLEGPDDELKRMADTFDATLDRLDRAFRSQREFLAQTSHDLRTPLAVIRSNLDVTMSDPSASVEEWRTTGAVVTRAAGRMSAMIDDLLAAARLEAGSAQMVNLDLAELATNLATEFEARFQTSRVELELWARSVRVEGDPGSLMRAAGNLIDNALRVAPEGSGVVVATGVHGGWAYLAIGDRGPGIDPEVAQHELPGRSGLGLAIVRQIAEVHGGHLEAVGRPGGGSMLVIWLVRPDGRPEAPADADALPDL